MKNIGINETSVIDFKAMIEMLDIKLEESACEMCDASFTTDGECVAKDNCLLLLSSKNTQ
jgi:hypothetical protein